MNIGVDKMDQAIYMKCPSCRKDSALILSKEQADLYEEYLEDNKLIQDVFPELDVFKREFLITGYCIICQCRIFGKKLPSDLTGWKFE